MKTKFIELLKSTGRDGIETVISNLEKLGFFEAPASTKFHLGYKGGLVEHSLNVCLMAEKIRKMLIESNPEMEKRLPLESVRLAALTHDVCKAEVYKEGSRNVKNPTTGVWEKVPCYDVDYSHLPLGHGEKSVIRLMAWGVRLSVDEMLAIRWHMSAWDLAMQSAEAKGNLNAARDKCPLLTLLQTADMLASGILETEEAPTLS